MMKDIEGLTGKVSILESNLKSLSTYVHQSSSVTTYLNQRIATLEKALGQSTAPAVARQLTFVAPGSTVCSGGSCGTTYSSSAAVPATSGSVANLNEQQRTYGGYWPS